MIDRRMSDAIKGQSTSGINTAVNRDVGSLLCRADLNSDARVYGAIKLRIAFISLFIF